VLWDDTPGYLNLILFSKLNVIFVVVNELLETKQAY